jgi:hypothetical protein
MATNVFVAKEPFSTDVGGVPTSVQRGKMYSGDNAVVQENPHLFEEVAFGGGSGVEQATKAPGEKRGSKKATKAPGDDASPKSSEKD